MYRRIPKNNEYLYHFTSPDTFINYIKCSSLRFNFFSKVNDPKESKYWSCSLRKQDDEKYISNFHCPDKIQNRLLYIEFNDSKSELFKEIKNKIQVLCFTVDKYNNELHDKENAYLFRGFGNPYFWSHYGSSKEDRSLQDGICLQLYLKKIEDKFKNLEVDYRFEKRYVVYSNEVYEGNPKFINFKDLLEYNTYDLVKKCIFDHQDHYLFTKTKFWKAENEYRLVIFSDIEEYVYLNIDDCIASIILGEDINKEDEEKILNLAEERFIPVSKLDWGNAYPTAIEISDYKTKTDYD